MKIVALEIENYGPFYGRHRLELADRGLVCVLGDNQDEPRMNSNGSGKSSAPDALDWCLFGIVPRGDGADTVINDDAAHQGHGVVVRVFCEEDAGLLVIERYRKHPELGSGVRLIYNGEDQSSLDAKETQRWIEWHLGLDRQVFHAAVLFAQSELFCFADATDSQRLEILTKILRLELIDAWLERAKGVARTLTLKTAEGEKALAALQAAVDVLGADVDSGLFERYEAERRSRVEALHHDVEVAQRAVVELSAELLDPAAMEAARQQLNARPPALLPEHAQARHDLAEAKKAMVPIARQLIEAQAKLREAQEQAQRRDCTACGQPLTAEHLQHAHQRLVELQTQVQGLTDVSGQWAAYHDQIQTALTQMDQDFERAKIAHAEQMAALRAQVQQSMAAHARVGHAKQRVVQVQQQLQAAQTAPNPAQTQQQERQAEKAAKLHSMQQWRDALDGIAQQQDAVAFWIEAFGSKGLKSYILDARLEEMTQAANHWVQLLTGGTYWIRLETQTATAKGALRNKFNIRVFNGHNGAVRERNYKSWSGGQKQRVSLAVDFGLSRLIAKRAQKHYDLLILDEVFKHLDSKGREAVMEMLQALRAEKATILVVDHDAEFNAQFEQQLVVRMEGGQASFVQDVAPVHATPAPLDAEPAQAKPKAVGKAKPKASPKSSPKRARKQPVRAQAPS